MGEGQKAAMHQHAYILHINDVNAASNIKTRMCKLQNDPCVSKPCIIFNLGCSFFNTGN